jgi:glyoxylase-like metal-dependent hydrolase (beta-lactamase superfamily II)
MKLFHSTVPPSPAGALPGAVFDDSFTLYRNGDTVDLAHIPPAHTDTDIWVYWEKADVLHTGDLFFNGIFPVIDESSNGSIGGMIAAGERILKQAGPNTKIIPGHGPLATRQDYVRFHQMLVAVRDKVAALKRQGLSEQEVVAKDPTAEFDATLGRGFMKADIFTGVVYRTL